jgi:hypothetical protein
VDAVRERRPYAPRHLEGQPALADAAGARQGHQPQSLVGQQLGELIDGVVTADGRGQRDRRHAGGALRVTGGDVGARREPFGQQHHQVVLHQVGELVRRREPAIGRPVVDLDASEQLGQAGLALGRRVLDVQQLGQDRGAEVLVLQPGDRLVRRHPAVALPVDPHEHVALREVGAVQAAWRVGSGAELEHHRCEVQLLDGTAHRGSLRRELLQRGADEDTQPLIRRADERPVRSGDPGQPRASWRRECTPRTDPDGGDARIGRRRGGRAPGRAGGTARPAASGAAHGDALPPVAHEGDLVAVEPDVADQATAKCGDRPALAGDPGVQTRTPRSGSVVEHDVDDRTGVRARARTSCTEEVRIAPRSGAGVPATSRTSRHRCR